MQGEECRGKRSGKMTGECLGKITGRTSRGMSGGMFGEIPGRTSGGISGENVRRKRAGNVRGNVWGKFRGERPGECSEKTSGKCLGKHLGGDILHPEKRYMAGYLANRRPTGSQCRRAWVKSDSTTGLLQLCDQLPRTCTTSLCQCYAF